MRVTRHPPAAERHGDHARRFAREFMADGRELEEHGRSLLVSRFVLDDVE